MPVIIRTSRRMLCTSRSTVLPCSGVFLSLLEPSTCTAVDALTASEQSWCVLQLWLYYRTLIGNPKSGKKGLLDEIYVVNISKTNGDRTIITEAPAKKLRLTYLLIAFSADCHITLAKRGTTTTVNRLHLAAVDDDETDCYDEGCRRNKGNADRGLLGRPRTLGG